MRERSRPANSPLGSFRLSFFVALASASAASFGLPLPLRDFPALAFLAAFAALRAAFSASALR